MDFRHFLKAYMTTIHHEVKTEGKYEGGVWVPGTEKLIPFSAAIVPFNDDVLQFGEAGTYTDNDRKIFTYRKLKDGDKILIEEQRYTITGERDFSFYGKGLKVYIGRREGNAGE